MDKLQGKDFKYGEIMGKRDKDTESYMARVIFI